MSKKFRSIHRAVRRGHLILELDNITKTVNVFRRGKNKRKILYSMFELPVNQPKPINV